MSLICVSLISATHLRCASLNRVGRSSFRFLFTQSKHTQNFNLIFKLKMNFTDHNGLRKSLCKIGLELAGSHSLARCISGTRSDENLQSGNQSVEKVCRFWTEIMEKSNIPEARVSVEYIVAHVLGKKTMHGLSVCQELTPQQMDIVTTMCHQRLQHKPVQYILGEWDFHDIELEMRPPVFIPRPETEELVHRAASLLETKALNSAQLLELCCGSGAIILSLLHKFPMMRGVAVDISPQAASLTADNAQRLGLTDRLTVLSADLSDPKVQRRLEDLGPFDMLVSNPPYIPSEQMTTLEPHVVLYEDPRALDGGADGLDITRHILSLAPAVLHPDSDILLEIQPGQPELIEDIVSDRDREQSGLQYVASHHDYLGRERFCHLRTVGGQQWKQLR